MNDQNTKIIGCGDFEEHLSEYIEKTLDAEENKALAAHALKCPICHTLLNEVKEALEICRGLSTPASSLTKLEARVLEATIPRASMRCSEFEEHLTDYLDGYLPAGIFHRWERHAAVCENCTDLPGQVVRSIAACVTYKLDEFALPDGLHDRILNATIGTVESESLKPSWVSQVKEWLRNIDYPVSVPQLAPVAMMLLFAFLVFSQTASQDATISGMYQKSFELAGQTYKQGTDLVLGSNPEPGRPTQKSGNGDPGAVNK